MYYKSLLHMHRKYRKDVEKLLKKNNVCSKDAQTIKQIMEYLANEHNTTNQCFNDYVAAVKLVVGEDKEIEIANTCLTMRMNQDMEQLPWLKEMMGGLKPSHRFVINQEDLED